MIYDLAEHRHRFAVWAAARAAQRGFTSVERLRGALEATSIQSDLRLPATLALRAASFDEMHRAWCRSTCATLSRCDVKNVAFGRAAKLVAVYLKTMVLMGGDWDTPLARCMHPPLDRILLQALASSDRYPHLTRENGGESAGRNWTKWRTTGSSVNCGTLCRQTYPSGRLKSTGSPPTPRRRTNRRMTVRRFDLRRPVPPSPIWAQVRTSSRRSVRLSTVLSNSTTRWLPQ